MNRNHKRAPCRDPLLTTEREKFGFVVGKEIGACGDEEKKEKEIYIFL